MTTVYAKLQIRLAEAPPCEHCGEPWANDEVMRWYNGRYFRILGAPVEPLHCDTCNGIISVRHPEDWRVLDATVGASGFKLAVPLIWLEVLP